MVIWMVVLTVSKCQPLSKWAKMGELTSKLMSHQLSSNLLPNEAR